MFQIVSIFVIIAVVYIANSWRSASGLGSVWQTISSEWQATWRDILSIGSGKLRRDPAALKQFCKRLGWFSFGLLAITGFLPVIFLGQHLSGYPLLIHMFAAPVLLVTATLYLVMSARSNELSESDWQDLSPPQKDAAASSTLQLFESPAWRKIWYWVAVILFIPAIVSIALGMYDMFGTEGQEMVLTVHGYTTLALTALAILLGAAVLRKREIVKS